MLLILIPILILLIFLIIFLICIPSPSPSLQKNKFSNGDNITFFSQRETSDFLLSDPDNYILNMTNIDLQARGIIGNYNQISASLATDFSQEEKQELLSLIDAVKNNFKNTMYEKIFRHNIIFAKTDSGSRGDLRSEPRGDLRSEPRGDLTYENGFPHTRNNIIFLSPLFFRQMDKLNTLEHECIHLFQRFYPIDTEKYLNSMGFEKKGDFQLLFPDLYKVKRSNPDIDNNIWADPNGNFMFPIFSSDHPKSLNDVHSHDMEHPYEWMAYRTH
jgi:hypothetical protein